ncbi:DUF2179 domain-containing protein [Peptostreptococcaceae bacterium AGR-M142]
MFFSYLFIFTARSLDMSMATIRTIMIVRGKKFTAAFIGFFEIILYVMAIGKVLSNLDNIGNVIAYAAGFATGNYLGVILEEKMAIGSVLSQIITKKDEGKFSMYLRDNDFGVTSTSGEGKEGKISILKVVSTRKELYKLNKLINDFDENAFTTVSDIRNLKGGYIKRSKLIKKK